MRTIFSEYLLTADDYMKERLMRRIFKDELSKEGETTGVRNYYGLAMKVESIINRCDGYGVSPEVLATALINVATFAKYRKDTDSIIDALNDACNEWDIKGTKDF